MKTMTHNVVRVPGTVWESLGSQTQPRMSAHDIICVHTMAGSLAGTRAYFRQRGYGGTESHLGIGGDGLTYQWQDLSHTADANYQGNLRVVSIETADRGEMFPGWTGSDVPAWTAAQIDRLVETIDWICDRFRIPRNLIPDTCAGRRGLAYHRQGIDHYTGNRHAPGGPWRKIGCERWSTAVSKVCPGDRRIAQFRHIVIPRVQSLPFAPTTRNINLLTLLRDGMFIVREKDSPHWYLVRPAPFGGMYSLLPQGTGDPVALFFPDGSRDEVPEWTMKQIQLFTGKSRSTAWTAA